MVSFCIINEYITLNSQHGSEQRCRIADDLLPLCGRTSLLCWIDRGVFDGSLLQIERSARCVACGDMGDRKQRPFCNAKQKNDVGFNRPCRRMQRNELSAQFAANFRQ